MTASDDIAAMRAGLKGVTPGPWQVTEVEHPWVLPAKPEWGRPAEKSGVHTERQIATVTPHPQSHSPWQIVCQATGIGIDEPVHFVHIGKEDAAHIANCDPDTIRSLLDRLAAAEARAGRATELLRPFAEGSVDVSGAAIIVGYPTAHEAHEVASRFIKDTKDV